MAQYEPAQLLNMTVPRVREMHALGELRRIGMNGKIILASPAPWSKDLFWPVSGVATGEVIAPHLEVGNHLPDPHRSDLLSRLRIGAFAAPSTEELTKSGK